MADTEGEKRAYSRGYAAGRKRSEADQAKWEKTHADIHSKTMQRRDEFFKAALTGLLANQTWTTDGRPTKREDYVRLARDMADEAVSRM